MYSHFVADGESRWYASPEVDARLDALRREIDSRYATQMESAGLFRRLALHWYRWTDYLRERRLIVPSPESLF